MVRSVLTPKEKIRQAGQLETKLAILASEYLTVDATVKYYRAYLKLTSETIVEAFHQKLPVTALLKARSNSIDKLLCHLWQLQRGDKEQQLTLIAVGGYGRAELHPYSDIDLLLLYSGELSTFEHVIQSFITLLWDTGLEIGHSVRSVKDCVTQAKTDITIATSLMEARPLIGNNELFEKMQELTGPENIWSGETFFAAKYQEQRDRYLKFQKTSYSLEPNIKKSPGTLRDIQMVDWVATRHFHVNSLEQLIGLGFLTKSEFMTIERCEIFLWEIRFALHIVAGRGEDRLLFDHQRPVADMLGLT
ncbi:MAG: [protein-PII] uridylyltransferase, partial [Enterobacterales bacterium]